MDGKLIFDTTLDTTGIKQGLQKLKSTSTDTLNSTGTVLEQTGAKLTNFITKPAIAAGTALTGLTLVKGFNRLKDIDSAKSKLESLGHSAEEVESIMDSAMQSVKGTAYGFGDAANIAASAVASGVSEGEELTRYLSLIGDAASVAGVSLSEMGGVFNKIQANGKISMEEVNQLADKGIPIYKMLGDQLGVTQDQIKSMVSEGKVDCETFYKATERYMGGAAKENKSFVTTIANVGASLGRIGANFLDGAGNGKGVFSQLKPLLDDFTNSLGKIEEKAAVWGEKFGSAFAKVVTVIKAIPTPLLAIGTAAAVSAGPMLQLSGKILKTAGAIKTFKAEQQAMSLISAVANGKLTLQQAILVKLQSALKGGFTACKNFITGLTAKVTATTSDTVATTSNTMATRLNGSTAQSAAAKVLAFASAHRVALLATTGLVAGIALLAGYLIKSGTSADQLANKITNFANNASVAITSFANAIPQILPKITTALSGVISSITKAIPSLIPAMAQAGITLFTGLVQSIGEIITPIINALGQVVTALVGALPTLIPALVQGGITLFMGLVQAIPTIILALVNALPDIVNAIVGAIPTLVPAIITGGITLLTGLIQAIPTVATTLVKNMPKIIKAIVKGLINGHTQIYKAGANALKKLWSGISSWVGTLGSKVASVGKALPGKIKSGLGSLVTIGKNWIAGLWNGIKDKKNWLCNKIKSLASDAKDAIKKFFKIKSPSRVMRDEVGRYITEGLGLGIVAETPSLLEQVKAQAREVKSAYSGALNGDVTATVGARFAKNQTAVEGVGVGETKTVNQTVNFYSETKTPTEIARELKKWNNFGLAGV